VVNVEVVRAGPCEGGNCAQRFTYDWDEVGQLAHAARYDFADGDALTNAGRYPDTTAALTAAVDITYQYSGATRVRKSVSELGAAVKHTLDLNEMWRVEGATADPQTSYAYDDTNLSTYVAGARILEDGGPSPTGNAFHMFHEIGDQLGSSSMIIDHETSEIVERTAYHAHGAIDSDYRPARWHEYRESFKFTGKEDDGEVGLSFFGARYYSPYLKQWMSADPLAIDGLAGDPNPYAYVRGRTSLLTDPDGLDSYDSNGNGQEGSGGGAGCPSCGDAADTTPLEAGCPTPGGGGGGAGGGGMPGNDHVVRATPKPVLPRILSVLRQAAAYQNTVAVGTLRELGVTTKIVTAGVSPMTIPLLIAQRGDQGLDKLYATAEKGLDPGLRTAALIHSKVGAAVITAAATAGAGGAAAGTRAAAVEASDGAGQEAAQILENLVAKHQARLIANPGDAAQYLTEAEQLAGPRLNAANFGKALERAVGAEVRELYPHVLKYVGGPNSPDFVGVGAAAGRTFDITTFAQQASHYGRPYGSALELILYHTPKGWP
jgi:RHS repeat-associated protein